LDAGAAHAVPSFAVPTLFLGEYGAFSGVITLRRVRVLGCISDLMSSTRLQDASRALDQECVIVRRPEGLLDAIAGVDLVVVDLDIATGDGVDAVRIAHDAGVAVIAYGGHVAAERLQGARDAGADAVFTRGDFVRRLPELLRDAGN
jgi:hypothetical protein